MTREVLRDNSFFINSNLLKNYKNFIVQNYVK